MGALAELDGLDAGILVAERYRVLRTIASGGVCRVVEAEHAFTGRRVAVKLLLEGAQGGAGAKARLLQEARLLDRVRHPGVVEVLDAGECPRLGAFVTLEMLEGRSLDGVLLTRGRLELADAAHVGRQLADALAFLHARGVVHRDIKPGNLFLTRDRLGAEIVKVFDLGISSGGTASAPRPKLTSAGEVLGTPEYMAPEQLMAEPQIDARADIYAAGVTLFECLTGVVPYSGSYPEVLVAVAQATGAPDPRAVRADLPEALSEVVQRALARAASERYQDAQQLANALVEATQLSAGHSNLLGTSAPRPGVRPQRVAVQPPPLRRPPRPSTQGPQRPPEEAPRRLHVRAPYVTPLRVLLRDGTVVTGRTEDISAGGLLAVLERPVPNGEPVRIRFVMPLTGAVTSAVAIARWAKTGRGQAAVGLQFCELTVEELANIQRYIEAVTARPHD